MKSILYLLGVVLMCTPLGSRAANPRAPLGGRATAATAPCANPGKDGSPTALTGVVNTYFAGTATASSGSRTISVAASGGASTGITAGDLLLVIQMQGADINSANGVTYGSNGLNGNGNLTTNFTAGTYEYVVAAGSLATGTSGTISLASGLVNSYSNAAATSSAGRRSFQVVRIPQYGSVTLGGQVNALAWDGNMGGVLVMDVANTLNLNGQTLNAAGLGFRGGAGRLGTGNSGTANTDYRAVNMTAATSTTNGIANGTKGEGTAGTPRYTAAYAPSGTANPFTLVDNTSTTPGFGSGVVNGYPNGDNGRGGPGNAGGGANDDAPAANGQNSGGAGGGNGNAGGQGGYPRGNTLSLNRAIGGATSATASTTRLVMGGGGGSGSTNDGNGDTNKTGIASSGSPGGGIIMVRTGSVSGTGTANASGAGGFTLVAGNGTNDGAGGGGAGGTVLVTAKTTAGLANLTVLATGGTGNSNANSSDVAHGPGGGGAGGVVLANASLAAATSVAGGAAGTTTASSNSGVYGAAAGSAGTTTTNISTSIDNSVAGTDCLTNDILVTTISGPATVGVGQAVTYIATTQNISLVDVSSVAPTIQLPTGLTNVSVTNGSYSSSTGLVTFSSTTLAAGTSLANSVSFVAMSTGTYTGKASSTSGTTETVVADNNGTQTAANVTTQVTAALCSSTTTSIGKDGSPTNLGTGAPAGGLVVNTYFPAGATTATLAAGSTAITVGTPAGNTGVGISAGDLLLVIQMQGTDINTDNTNLYGDGITGDPASGYLLNGNFTAGTYEYVTVGSTTLAAGAPASGSTTTINLASGLINSYSNAAATATTGPRTYQVIRVPQYGNVTLAGNIGTAQWDGTKGGVLAMEVAGKLNFAGFTISSAARGFRGGRGRQLQTASTTADYRVFDDGATSYGQKGESIAGTPQYMRYYSTAGTSTSVDNAAGDTYPGGGEGRGAAANGGGGTSTVLGGGAGGGNATAGGFGGYNYSGSTAAPAVDNRAFGGAMVAQVSSSRLVMGGGGGAGNLADNTTTNSGATITPATAAPFSGGAQGGGITIIRAGSVAGTGVVDASGRDSGSSTLSGGTLTQIRSTGGGGAGGTILVTLRDATGLSSLTANNTGGKGGDNGNGNNPGSPGPAGPGGGGSGGIVIANGTFGTINNTGGRAGYSQYNSTVGTNVNFGATTGTTGVVVPLPTTGTDGAASNSASGGAPGTSANADCEDAPAAFGDKYMTTPGTAITFSGAAGATNASILTNDTDAVGGIDASTVDLDPTTPGIQQGTASSPITVPGGTAYVNATGQITFTPNSGFIGTSIFPYTVSDIYGKVSNQALVRVTVENPSYDLATAISTTASQPVTAGALVPFTLTATNNNTTTPAPNVVQTAQLQTGLTGTNLTITGATAGTPSGGIITYTGGTYSGATYNQTTGLLSFPAVTVTNGTPQTYTFSVAAPANGPYNVTAQVGNNTSDPVPGNNTATAAVTVSPSYNIGTTITGPATNPTAGDIVSYVVTARNASNSPAVSGVVQTVNIGTNRTGVYATNGGTYDASTGLVTFPAVNLATGQAINNTVAFVAPASGTAIAPVSTFTAASLTGDTNSGDNSATATSRTTTAATGTTAQGSTAATGTTANLRQALTATVSGTSVAPGTVAAGATVTYVATITNDGPSPAQNPQETLTIPTGLTGTTLTVSGSSSNSTSGNVVTYVNGTTTVATYNTASGLLSFPASTTALASQGTQSYTFTVTAPNSASLLTASAVATTTTSDPAPADNIATVQTNVVYNSVVNTQLTGPTSAIAGQPVVYNLTTTNAGTTTANNVTQSVAIPAGLLVSTTDPNGLQLSGSLPTSIDANTGVATFANGATYDPSTGRLTMPTLASMAGGQIVQNTITYLAPANTPLTNVATVAVGSPSNSGTANSSVTTTVSSASDVVVSINGPATASVGSTLTYAVTALNNGSSATLAANPTTFQALFPGGLPITGASAVKVNGQLPSSTSGTTATYADGSTYSAATGLVNFPSIAGQAPGLVGARTNTVTFDAPDLNAIMVGGVANTASASNDLNQDNNSAIFSTTLNASSTPSADLSITVQSSVTTQTAGQPVTFTVTPSNANTSGSAAANVRPQVTLVAGLPVSGVNAIAINGQTTPTNIANGIATYADGSVYNQNTGQVTFPTTASLAIGATGTAYTVKVPAPGTGPLVATASVGSDSADPNTANNTATQSVTITPSADLATAVTGPANTTAGSTVTYTVTTTNTVPATAGAAGGSPATNVQQVITIPASVRAGTPVVNGPNASSATISGTATSGFTITIPLGTVNVGAANAISNTITFAVNATPTGNAFAVASTVSTTSGGTNDANSNNNTSSQSTNVGPTGPTADDIVNAGRAGTNAGQKPIGSTAAGTGSTPVQVPITSLAATPTGTSTIASYNLLSFPDPSTVGTLYVNGTAVTAARSLTLAEASQLTFAPVSSFVGNAFFQFTATDNNGLTSNAARYTIPVNADVLTAYTVSAAKGGSNVYQNNDVIATFFDANGGSITTAGTVADNGVRTASTTTAGNTTLSNLGLTMNTTTGQITVADRTKLVAGTYTVPVTTTDVNNGVTTQNITFTIGAYPLPVVLTEFTAVALLNRDALLNWATASEASNDHFDVERSFDGTSFVKIGQLAGHGTTTAKSAYSLTDANVAAKATGPVYYRLRQVDLDGSATYSPVRTVSFTSVAAPVALSLYPNPAQASTTLELSQLPATGTYQVQLLDATGRTVRAVSLSGGLPQPLDISDLATGSYHVLVTGQLADGSPFKQTLRLTKE